MGNVAKTNRLKTFETFLCMVFKLSCGRGNTAVFEIFLAHLRRVPFVNLFNQ